MKTLFKLNDSLSLNKINDDIVAVSVNSTLKTLECDYTVLESVLNTVSKGISRKKLIDTYKKEYGEEDVKNFIQVLLDENIILQYENDIVTDNDIALLIIGDGRLADIAESHFKNKFKIVKSMNIEEFVNQPKYDYDAAIIVSGNEKYDNILKINELLVKQNKAFIMMHYDGEALICGPFVFPWQTPCFQCHVTHHLNAINRTNECKINMSNLRELVFSKELDEKCNNEQVKYALQLIYHDISKIKRDNVNLIFYKKEIIFKIDMDKEIIEKIYQPITDCECCHGMNKKFQFFNGKITPPKMHNPLDHKKIKYTIGGLRSKNTEETENLIKNAIDSLNLKIEIQRVRDSVFQSVLPVFHSTLKTTHKNKTPYFFTKGFSYGKGVNEKQAFFSASFELFERLSARYYGEKEIIRATTKQIEPYNVDLRKITSQIDKIDKVYDDYSFDQEIDWVWGHSLISGQAKLIPAADVFLTSASFKGNFVPNGSSGLSAGATLKDAILQGLFEVIEHDAWMICQANPIRLPIVKYDDIVSEELKEVINKIRELGFEIISRDYTSDLGIPVIRTWIYNPNNYVKYAYNGFGCSVYSEIALERSITEAVQGFIPVEQDESKEYCRLHMVDTIRSRDSLFGLYYFQQKDIISEGSFKSLKELPNKKFNSVDETLDYVTGKLKKVMPDCDIVYVDFTRKTFNIPAVKVIVTGDIQRLSEPLVTISPRTYNFVKNMGYKGSVPRYDELYLGPYQH